MIGEAADYVASADATRKLHGHVCIFPAQVIRGHYEGEVQVFGSRDVQQKAREMIAALISPAAGDPGRSSDV